MTEGVLEKIIFLLEEKNITHQIVSTPEKIDVLIDYPPVANPLNKLPYTFNTILTIKKNENRLSYFLFWIGKETKKYSKEALLDIFKNVILNKEMWEIGMKKFLEENRT